jgi:hypothetical protein
LPSRWAIGGRSRRPPQAPSASTCRRSRSPTPSAQATRS